MNDLRLPFENILCMEMNCPAIGHYLDNDRIIIIEFESYFHRIKNLNGDILTILNYVLPVKCNFISMSAFYSLVEQIEADIRRCSFHPFYENITFIYIEIVWEILVFYRWRFPVKFLSNFAPELHWILYRSRKKKKKKIYLNPNYLIILRFIP